MKMIHRVWKSIAACLLLSFLLGCASTGNPSGGPRDNTPPSLVEEKSSKNFSTNFKPEKIELVFDEWIELKNQQREILISPPFFKTPKITSRGKKVTVEFPKEEPLREDATYTLNFGKSIVDFTEGNPAEGFRFIFATGDRIDSLSFEGKLKDAKTSEPVKDILVLLYDVVEDSVVVYEKPFYYARTDESGSFKFENLKNDTFKVFVLEDINFNYLLDPEVERLAFPDSLFILNDSSSYSPSLRLFTPEQSLRISSSSSQTPGLVTTLFNKQAEEVDFSFLYPFDFDPLIEKSKDTLMFWFTEPLDSIGVIYELDTLDFLIKPFDSTFYARQLSIYEFNADKTILAPFDSLKISFIAPLSKIDTSLIRLTNQPKPITPPIPMDSTRRGRRGMPGDSTFLDSLFNDLDTLMMDSLKIPMDSLLNGMDSILQLKDSLNVSRDRLINGIDTLNYGRDSLGSATDSFTAFPLRTDSLNVDPFVTGLDSTLVDSLAVIPDTALVDYDFEQSFSLRHLYINSDWQEKSKYRLELLPGAVTDIYGRQNDTLLLEFSTAGLNEFGSISINLSGLDSAQHYVVLLKLNDEIVKKNQVIDVDSKNNKIVHNRLRANTYSIELIKDDNNDGEWTTGDYWLKRQPEEIKIFTLEKLREDWDLEANVFWNEGEGMPIDTSGMLQDSSDVRMPPGSGDRKKSGREIDKSGRGSGIVPDPKGKND